ncbi:hypothetical protein SO802_028867 [Lithocarpus litseifolius]|uniref:Ycf2 protein n=1 Tax=Lithocarpus litseifolius TaxID=425828 RepID=A0AAW2BSG2_9ROSI
MEKEVDFESLESTFIPNMFKDRTWAFLLTGLVAVHNILIREFFLNAIMEGDHLNCWVRGKEFTILAMSIQNFLQIRLVIPVPSLPYDKRKTSVSEVVPDLGGVRKKQPLHTTSFSPYMRTLAYIMLFKPLSMYQQEEDPDDSAIFIMSITHQERVKIPSSLSIMKRESPISSQTMTRSKAHLRGLEEEEGALNEDTAHEGGNIDDEIDNFTLGQDDMDASPTQAQPQEQPQAPPHALNRLDLLLDRLDHLQRSFDEHSIESTR